MLTKPLIIAMLFIGTTILIFCKPVQKKKHGISDSEFEGVITYHEIRKSSDGLINVDDTVQHFYSHGNFVNIHSTKSFLPHIVKDYYFAKPTLRLNLFSYSDTLYQLNLHFPAEELETFKVTKVNGKILSRKCENIEITERYLEKDSTTYTTTNYTFSRNYLPTDKAHFANWNLGFFNKVINETGAFYLNLNSVHYDSSHKNILYTLSYDVISVKEGPVDPNLFKINAELIKYTK